ncbi:hypothetical protein [Paenibacillus hamazuiensis]|uniref:hypothetical protein n=1 Tax=Paenibacillus hamazuiensis TaxID=2936508 RepID=UPI00200E072E|nr:hypothetical protein [Paenibacillus hamazuiensis]
MNKLLPLPNDYDINEWFVLGSLALVMTLTLALPKRFAKIEIYYIWLFNAFLSLTVDLIIAVPPYDMYDISDNPSMELIDLLTYFLLYPPAGYLAMYAYDLWKPHGYRVLGFVILCALVSWGLEFLAWKTGVFRYKTWRIEYSVLVYIAVYALNVRVLQFARRHSKKEALRVET